MCRIVSNHRRVIAAVWVAVAVFFVLTAAILSMMRFDAANQRIDSRVSHFTAHVAAQPGASAASAVGSFLSLNIPDSDEVLAGIVDGEVIRMERAGRSFTVGDALHRDITGQARQGSDGSLPDLRFTSVTVHDAEGEQAMLVAAIDSSAQRQRDHTLLTLIAVLEVLLAAGVTAVAQIPARARREDGETGKTGNTEAAAQDEAEEIDDDGDDGDPAPANIPKALSAPSPTPGKRLRDIVVGPPEVAYPVRSRR